jgi:putative glutamine amidotransferase
MPTVRTISKPRIAVLLDENTSSGGTRYEAAKGYFRGISDAGGLPFGIPYLPEIVGHVLADFDGYVSVGGRFAYPDAWYEGDQSSKASPSERLEVERALIEGFLSSDKPLLGICAGMQMMACLNGCRLTPDVQASIPNVLPHDRRDYTHPVTIAPDTLLSRLLGTNSASVNTFHREAVAILSDRVVVSARAPDGVVEAIEIPTHRFAIGIQWHQELFIGQNHPGNAVFRGLVEAAR